MNEVRSAVIRNGVLYKVDNLTDTENTGTPIGHVEIKEPSWNWITTDLFLNECIKRKEALQNPQVVRRSIFVDIRSSLASKGYHFDIITLDRKFRNLKTHLLFVRSNNKKSYSRRISWQYYKKMDEIFPKETMKATRRSSIQKISSSPQNIEEDKTPPKNYKLKKLDFMRNEILAFEERRTIAIEAIAVELEESNKLSRQILELDKRKFEEKNTDKNEFY